MRESDRHDRIVSQKIHVIWSVWTNDISGHLQNTCWYFTINVPSSNYLFFFVDISKDICQNRQKEKLDVAALLPEFAEIPDNHMKPLQLLRSRNPVESRNASLLLFQKSSLHSEISNLQKKKSEHKVGNILGMQVTWKMTPLPSVNVTNEQPR